MASFSGEMKTLGILTSGGDAPGMNAAIRAVVRTAVSFDMSVKGIIGGFAGLLDGNIETLGPRAMANIIQRGGTILKTGRCLEFHKTEARKLAAENLRRSGVQGLIVIGGDGSFQGAHLLWKEQQFPCVGVPGTIDNDILGTDLTIGFDTAVNTALSAIDKIRDTADSHDRLFIIEVMGRESGFIASWAGLAGGAEEIFTPEFPLPLDKVVEKIKAGIKKGKRSSILVAAEGQKPGRAYDLAEQVRKKSGIEAKVCILGHQQRGGSPTANDRILASRLGMAAVKALADHQCDLMVGIQSGKVSRVAFDEVTAKRNVMSKEFIEISSLLSM